MRGLPGSLLALALAVTLAHAQTAPPAAPEAPSAPGANAAGAAGPATPGAPRAARPSPFASATPQPVFPLPAALAGPVTFNCGAAKKGATALTASSVYSESAAGWDFKSMPKVDGGVCSSDKPFFFSIAVPEGDYRVTIAFGGSEASEDLVRAEARRLMLEKIAVKAAATVSRSFDVNVRVAEFNNPDGTPNKVRLKAREYGNLNWDNKLTLEFNGTNPSFHSIVITPLVGAKAEPVVYLAGDSTMVDQDNDPAASWGQQLPRFFLPGVVIANEAESGETSASFQGELRFAKVMSVIKPGDYFFMQFNHNDQKPGAVPLDRYKQILADFAAQVRAKGATPVIVTAQNRRTFDESGHVTNSLAEYPQAARDVASTNHIAMIDLTAMSKVLYEAMGPEGSKHLFHGTDITHFDNYGAYELARCIVHGIRQDDLPMAKFLDPAVPDFNPAKFDPFETFVLAGTPAPKRTPGAPPPNTPEP